MNRYSLIYADPAWSYGNQISNGAAVDHYPTHWGNQCATASVELIPGCAIDVVKTEAA